jgi:hypothetical protein
VFERFVQGSPVSVMVRGTLEFALPASVLDELFERTAAEQYTGELWFSSVVELLGLAVCKIRPSVHAAYQASADRLPVSVAAVYQKLAGVEPAVTAALVRESARRLEPVLAAVSEVLDHLSDYRQELDTLMTETFHIVAKAAIPVAYQEVA